MDLLARNSFLITRSHPMPRFVAAVLFLLTFACPSIPAVDYAIVAYPEYQQGYVLTGKITTDGTIGDLTGKITAWEWYTSNGTITWAYDSTQPRTSVTMNGVRATADGQIVMDRIDKGFTTAQNLLSLSGYSVANTSPVSLRWISGALDSPDPGFSVDGFGIVGSRSFPLPAWAATDGLKMPDTTGPIVIATLILPVPEPSTYVLTLVSLGCLGLLRKARRR